MPGLYTPPTLKALYTTLRKDWDGAIGQVSTDLSRLWTPVSSQVKTETYAFIGNFPKMREWLGARQIQGLKERIFQITNKDYEETIGVDRNSFDDGLFIEKQMVVRNLAAEASRLPNDLVIDLMVNGQTRLCYDGQFFFDTDHPNGDPDVAATGTQSNYVSSGFALTRANFVDARARMRRWTGENGRPFGFGFNLLLVVPPELETTARDIVDTDNVGVVVGSGAAMQKNTLYKAAETIVIPELSPFSSTAWYLFDVSPVGDPKPFIMQTRKAPVFQYLGDPNVNDTLFFNKEYLFGADCRMGAGYGAWFRAFKASA